MKASSDLRQKSKVYGRVWRLAPLVLLAVVFVRALALDLNTGEMNRTLAPPSLSSKDTPLASLLPGRADLTIFYKPDCLACLRAKPFIEKNLHAAPKLRPEWVDLTQNSPARAQELQSYIASIPSAKGLSLSVPVVFIGNIYLLGPEAIRAKLPKLLSLYQSGSLPPPLFLNGQSISDRLTLWTLSRVTLSSIINFPSITCALAFLVLIGASLRYRVPIWRTGGAFIGTASAVVILLTFGYCRLFYSQDLLSKLSDVHRCGVILECLLLVALTFPRPRPLKNENTEVLPRPESARRAGLVLSGLAFVSASLTVWISYPFLGGSLGRTLYYGFAYSSEPMAWLVRILEFGLLLGGLPFALGLLLGSFASRNLGKPKNALLALPIRLAAAAAAVSIGVFQVIALLQGGRG